MPITPGHPLATWTTQLRKGLLEFCVLSVLDSGDHYGYAIVDRLKQAGVMSVSQGAVYPVLHRLRHEGFVDGRVEASDRGPQRRYFSLTPLGRRRLSEMREHWTGLTRSIEQLDGTPKRGGKKP